MKKVVIAKPKDAILAEELEIPLAIPKDKSVLQKKKKQKKIAQKTEKNTA